MTAGGQYLAMIVDDEPFVREDLKFLLAGYPHVAVAWETGTLEEARTLLAGK
jgi:DNA-binding NarL/FixJ family response regulator